MEAAGRPIFSDKRASPRSDADKKACLRSERAA
jgi:hypothetical protein